jgi:hypothetical protein
MRIPSSEIFGVMRWDHQPLIAPKKRADKRTANIPPAMYASPAKLAEMVTVPP